MRPLRVHFLPELLQPAEWTANPLAFDGDPPIGGTCVVIDVLRATTTIVTALAAGARSIWPCSSIDEARERARDVLKGFPRPSTSATAPETVVLGGERGGLKIEGFDLGNSPAEYTAESVGGKAVVLTTTNGTKALLHAVGAKPILGAFVNLSAVCRELGGSVQVDLLCAGTDGKITREDVLLAGAIVARLTEEPHWQPDDQALIARDAWLHVAGRMSGNDLQARLVAALRASRGGRNLIEIGMAADIELAADIDRFTIVPRFHADKGKIV